MLIILIVDVVKLEFSIRLLFSFIGRYTRSFHKAYYLLLQADVQAAGTRELDGYCFEWRKHQFSLVRKSELRHLFLEFILDSV